MKWLGAVGLIAVGMLSASALAGIQNTKHDLSTGSTSTSKSTAGTDQICVFCHTPHGSRAANEGPLWNRAPGTAAVSFSTYANPESMDSTNIGPSTSSLACLSCHDGTVAMDNLVNAPGSGGYNAAGSLKGYTWPANVNIDTSNGNKLKAGIVALIGTDLTNDHPIGIAYCGGFKSTGGGGCVDGDFFTAALLKNGTASVVNGTAATDKWWIDATANGTRDKTDLIMFSRNFPLNVNNSGFQPSVECATCHNVHDNTNVPFLRMSNTGSALCLACHNK